jgi:tetratricopeptide (TPR) repeat protein
VAENPRIEELRRRVQKDPASIAFAQLAEEYRRAGNYEEAIAICRVGLQTHPSYLSARVTLGRALIEINDLDSAEPELQYVLQHAAENLAAIRAIAEIHHRRGELTQALAFYKSALELARHDPDLEQTVEEISREILRAPVPQPEPVAPTPAVTSQQSTAEFLANTFDLLELDPVDLELVGINPVDANPAVAEPVVAEPTVVAPLVTEPTVIEPEVVEPVVVQPAMLEPPAMAFQHMEAFEPVVDWPEAEVPLEIPIEIPIEMPPLVNPALLGLEQFLEAIHSYRQRRAV